MERCNYVEFFDGFHHDLEEVSRIRKKVKYKLKEIDGEVIFCEPDQRGLVIKLKNYRHPEATNDKEIIWDYAGKLSLPVICGQGLRCFYEEENEGNIHIDAWELMNEENSNYVVRRATKSHNYKFIS